MMYMDMGRALGDGVVGMHMTLETLVQIPSLGDVDRHPTSVLGLASVNIVGRQRWERSIDRVAFVGVFCAGLPRPVDKRRGGDIRLLLAMEYVT